MKPIPCPVCLGSRVMGASASIAGMVCIACDGTGERVIKPLVQRPDNSPPHPALTPLDIQTVEQIRKEMNMDPSTNPAPAPVAAKTPVLQDKRLWLSVATVVSLLLAKLIKIEIDPEIIAGIVLTVLGYITNSAVKEAKVAKVLSERGE